MKGGDLFYEPRVATQLEALERRARPEARQVSDLAAVQQVEARERRARGKARQVADAGTVR